MSVWKTTLETIGKKKKHRKRKAPQMRLRKTAWMRFCLSERATIADAAMSVERRRIDGCFCGPDCALATPLNVRRLSSTSSTPK